MRGVLPVDPRPSGGTVLLPVLAALLLVTSVGAGPGEGGSSPTPGGRREEAR